MNKKSKKLLLSSAAVLSTAVIMGTSLTHQESVQADTTSPASHQTREDIASGTYGTSSWYISATGVLHIGAGELGPASDNPWNEDHSSNADRISSIVFDGQVKANQDSSSLFKGLKNATSIDNLKDLDTSDVTTMDSMFYNCSSLKNLDVSNFNTSKVTNMEKMFRLNTSLENIDVSSFDTSNVTSMAYMFSSNSLTNLDLSNFNTSKVTTMAYMFSNSLELTNVNLSSFDTSNVETMEWMFWNDGALKTLDLSSFNTKNLKIMNTMFGNNASLKELDLSNFDTSNVQDMAYAFRGMSLDSLDISNFNTSNVQIMDGMFGIRDDNTGHTDTVIKQLTVGPNTKLNSSTNLSIPDDPDTYTGKWQSLGTGTINDPNGEWVGTTDELIARSGTSETYVAQPTHNYVFTANDITVKQSEVANLLAENGDQLVKTSKAEVKDTRVPDNKFIIGVKDFGGLTDKVGNYTITLIVAGVSQGDIPQNLTKTINVTVVADSNSDNSNNTNPAVKYQKVYRLYNKHTGEHLYTESSYERDSLVKAGWTSEGTGWSAPNKGTAVYRVYNPNVKGGDHYYTASKYEATSLVKAGWKWDNNAKPIFYSGGKTPVYVAYNPNAQSGSHNYTTSSYEQQSLLNNGWKYGKIQFYGK